VLLSFVALSVTFARDTLGDTEAALAALRVARATILRDHFHRVHSVGAGLWVEEGGRAVLAEKLRDARLRRRPFVVAFGGTSITAGHDNYYNQTWVLQL
jgi:hypothetical protein